MFKSSHAHASVPSHLHGVHRAPTEVREHATGTDRLSNGERVTLAVEVPGGRLIELPMRALTIGSSPRCDIVIDDATVSASHCQVIPTRIGWEIRDRASTNGTYIGGVRVGCAVLSPGMEITLGRTRLLCVRAPNDVIERTATPRMLVGNTPDMERVRLAIARAARNGMSVLIQGETGSGKEVVARMVHEQSTRARGPFVAVNAGAIPAELVESELFGHERGAFTGAAGRRRGVFEEAHHGTLFLDELGELPLAQQAKLLRVLETREIRRVGGEGAIPVDVRIVCATHRDLADRVREGTFREDLFYRLDVLRVRLPPLRERAGDIPLLARHLLAGIVAELGVPHHLDDSAIARLVQHDWPGNVRELKTVLSRAAVVCEGERIGAEHLELRAPPSTRLTAVPMRESGFVPTPRRTERPPAPVTTREAIETMVAQCGGNLSRAARSLGLKRSTLRDRLRRT